MSNLSKPEKSWILYDVANSAFTMLISTTIPIFFRSAGRRQRVSEANRLGHLGTGHRRRRPDPGGALPHPGGACRLPRHEETDVLRCFLVLGIAWAADSAPSPAAGSPGIRWMFVAGPAGLQPPATSSMTRCWSTSPATSGWIRVSSLRLRTGGTSAAASPSSSASCVILVRPFGLSTQTATQISFVITAAVVGRADCPAAQKRPADPLPGTEGKPGPARLFHRVGQTLPENPGQKPVIFYFILGYFCYIDGVYTIISMATTYGNEVGIGDTSMILALLLTQFVAFPCAIFCRQARWEDRHPQGHQGISIF